MQSSLTTLKVLEVVGEHQPISVAEVAKLISRPKSSAQRALLTLHEGGWIRPNGLDRTRWLLTSRVVEVARHVGNQRELRDAAAPALGRLRDSTRESVSLCILDGDETVTIDFYEGHHTIRLISLVGVRLGLHAGASGKVILAHISREGRDRVLAGPLRSYSTNTVTSKRRLMADLRSIVANGYGVSIGEVTEGGVGIAAVILDPDGQPVGSVALLVPQTRASSAQLIGRLAVHVVDAAAEIERVLAGAS
jgi:IclR family transcriptional regulator, acetate operon repressor